VQLIAYYRVSTERQGQSGLGIEAQQAKVQQMAAERGATVVAEFTEVESGRKADRPSWLPPLPKPGAWALLWRWPSSIGSPGMPSWC
jgi:hypothetical protein